MKSTALIVLDGWGDSDDPYGNAVMAAEPTFFSRLKEKYPHTTLLSGGEAVGLPEGQMGNSEVGHLNIGAGRVVYQPLLRIKRDMDSGVFYDIPEVKQAFSQAKEKKKMHFLGLLSDGGVHSHTEHLYSMMRKAKEIGVEKVYVHAFLDGRDTDPHSGKRFLAETEALMRELQLGSIATVCGRYYAMDRDNRWERIKQAYDALVGNESVLADSALAYIESSYAEDITDEFVIPARIDPEGIIRPGDVVVFYNFRPDRARELTNALTQKRFDAFEHPLMHLDYYCMSVYDDTFEDVQIFYPHETIENTMGSVLSKKGLKQFRVAETEKYPHITFFFNGGREEPFEGEMRVLVHSPKVATYDLQPSMSAYEVKDALIKAVREGGYAFYLLNFANPDMVGHTGDFEATVKAIRTVDTCLEEIVATLEEEGVSFVITADHGNAEKMLGSRGETLTMHSTNPVPLIISLPKETPLRKDGILSDVAPTLFKMIGIESPDEFTGKSLF